MIKIMFVCLGNICRSPMAEFVFRDLVSKKGLSDKFLIASSATSAEEIGNGVHHGTRSRLKQAGISCEGKCAVQLKREDGCKYDYFIGMEDRNISNIKRILHGVPDDKIFRLLDFSDKPRDIADPWFTGDFELTYNDIAEGCGGLLNYILVNNKSAFE